MKIAGHKRLVENKLGLGLVSLLLLSLLLALLGSGFYPFQSAETPASEVGSITVYTALSEAEAALYLQDFQLVYPEIQVTLVRQPIDELSKRFLAEADAPNADVIWGVALRNLLLFEWNDQLTPYAPLGAERLHKDFIDSHIPPYWAGFYRSLVTFCVNGDAAARRGLPSPQSWSDLIKPIYRNSLVMPNPNQSSTGLTVLMTIFTLYGERNGWRYLDELHKNIARYSNEQEEPCSLVNRGYYPIAVSSSNESLNNLQIVYPSEGLGSEVMVGALVRKDPIQPAARTFLDWAVSKSVMPLYARQSPLTAMQTGISQPLNFPEDAETQLLHMDPAWGAANRSRILRQWLQRYSDKIAE